MDIATVIGIVGGSFLMVQAVMMDGGGGGGGFLDIPSVLITGGGTVCAVLVAFTLQEIKTVPQVLRKAIFKQEYRSTKR